MKTRTQFSFGIGAVLFAVVALGIPAIATAAPIDACSLMSSSDAEAALGEPVGPAQSEDRSGGAGQGTACKFRSAQGKALARKSVSLTVQQSHEDLSTSNGGIMEQLKSAGMKNVHEVGGIGDHAAWGTTSMLGKLESELTVLKGKHTMVIIIIMGVQDEPTALSRAKVLAAKVVPKA